MIGVISQGQVARHNLYARNHTSGTNATPVGTDSNTGKVITGSNPRQISSFLRGNKAYSQAKIKTSLSVSIQNAFSYVQTQKANLDKLEKIYLRMTDLASHASNPFLNDQAREGLMQEYEGLKNDSLLVRKETFMGKNLFDDMAAKHFPPVNYGDGFTDKGTGEYQLQQGPLSPKPSGYNNNAKYYEVEREVYFDRGMFSLEVNGGNTGERYILKQGEHIIFDTAGNNQDSGFGNAKWATVGTAYEYDFDKFEIEYAPGKPTTFKFIPQSTGNSTDIAGNNIVGDGIGDSVPVDDGKYDNKSKYYAQLNLGSSDGNLNNPWNAGDDFSEKIYSGAVGEVKTYPAIAGETKLTLRVEADTIFQIRAEFSNANESSETLDIETGDGESLKLEAVGVGITLIDSDITTKESAKDALDLLANEIDNLATQMGKIGANLSKLNFAHEKLGNEILQLQGNTREINEQDVIENNLSTAKSEIKLQGSRSLLAKAITTTRHILNLIT